MEFGCIGSDVGEPAIEGHENPAFGIADVSDFRVLGTAQFLFNDAGSVPAGIAEKLRELFREVLVDLEPHGHDSGR